jgi:tetratricopeptide (TPR) repeat protein
MTNEELISGFLDRSLSEDQLVELEARKGADPAFAAELRELIVIENALRSSAPVTAIPTDFLAHVEDTVAAKMAGSTTGILSGISTAWKAVGGAAIILGTAAGIYVASAPEQTTMPSAGTPVAKPVVTPPVITNPTINAEPAPSPEPARTTVAKPAARPTSSTSATSDGAVNANVTVTPPVLANLLKKYNDCVSSNDRTRCAQYALRIGAMYRDASSFAEATDYYGKALSIARSMNLVQYEVDALGGLGMMHLQRGNTAEARQHLRTAIERGSTIDGVNVEPYRRALETLGN